MTNLAALLAYPVCVSFMIQSHPLAATYLMLASTCLLLKLISFHHVMHDNRRILRNLSKRKKDAVDDPHYGMKEDVF